MIILLCKLTFWSGGGGQFCLFLFTLVRTENGLSVVLIAIFDIAKKLLYLVLLWCVLLFSYFAVNICIFLSLFILVYYVACYVAVQSFSIV
jgi:hypothetical protein